MSYKFEKAKPYKIRFYDHHIGGKDKMICEIVGWCILDDDEHAVFTHWIVDTHDDDIKKENVEPTSIIKSCILRVRKLF